MLQLGQMKHFLTKTFLNKFTAWQSLQFITTGLFAFTTVVELSLVHERCLRYLSKKHNFWYKKFQHIKKSSLFWFLEGPQDQFAIFRTKIHSANLSE